MRSRMTRYNSNDSTDTMSRSNRNKNLYDSLGSNTTYTTYTDVKDANAVVLDAASKNYRTREGYQKIKEYSELVPQPKVKKELDDFNYLYKNRENKIYDINSVIEEAKKNRIKKDELEEKRRLKNTNYNILASLDPEKLEEYKAERNKVIRANSDEIKELINTITTKTINGEIDKETGVNLLSDLMATQAMDRVEGVKEEDNINTDNNDDDLENNQVLKEEDIKLVKEKEVEAIEKDKELKDKNQSKNIFKDMDQSFYTRSMDLSDKDFEMDNDFSAISKKKVPGIVKAILSLILLLLIAVLIYFIVKSI